MKYYAVIDTNVLVSSLLSKSSNPGVILSLVEHGTIIPLFNEDILKEYEEVLSRNKFPFTKKKIIKTLRTIVKNGISLDRTKTDEKFFDQDDVVFYEIVLTSNKDRDSYLITGNIRHFPKKTFVVTPSQMLEIIESK